ncbi:hypothetical protein V6Z12_A10G101300 [Gossypium hirsutum]
MVGRESLKLGSTEKKFMSQYLYTRDEDERATSTTKISEGNVINTKQGALKSGFLKMSNQPENEGVNLQVGPRKIKARENTFLSNIDQVEVGGEADMNAFISDKGTTRNYKRARWTCKGRIGQIHDVQIEVTPCKQKNFSIGEESSEFWNDCTNSYKRAKGESDRGNSPRMETIREQLIVSSNLGSAAANRQANRSQ